MKSFRRLIVHGGWALLGVVPVAAWLLCDAMLTETLWRIREIYNPNSYFSDGLRERFWVGPSNWARAGLLAVSILWWIGLLGLSIWSDRRRVNRSRSVTDQSQDHAWMAIAAGHVIVLGLLLSQSSVLINYGLRWRIAMWNDELVALAQPFLDDWPTEPRVVPGLGKVFPHPRKPNRLWVFDREKRDWNFGEEISIEIDRSPTGDTVIFTLNSIGSPIPNPGINLVAVHRSITIQRNDQWLAMRYPQWQPRVPISDRVDLIAAP